VPKRKSREKSEDEEFEDDELAEVESDDPDFDEYFAIKTFDTSRKSYLRAYFNQAFAVLLHPKKFFAAMPEEGGVGSAFLFLTISSLIYGIAQGISKLDTWACVVPFLTSIFLTSMGSFILFFFLGTICKGKGTLGQTFRVMAYSKATLLFAWLTLGPVAIGGYVSTVYIVVLNVIGFNKVHRNKLWVSIAITFVFALLGMLFRKMTGLT
jgi:hypothetical protein